MHCTGAKSSLDSVNVKIWLGYESSFTSIQYFVYARSEGSSDTLKMSKLGSSEPWHMRNVPKYHVLTVCRLAHM